MSILTLKAQRTLLRQKRDRLKDRISVSVQQSKDLDKLIADREALVKKYNKQIADITDKIEELQKPVSSGRVDAKDLKVSKAGLDLIKHFEGFYKNPYVDPVGIWTAGYGHTFPGLRKPTDKEMKEWSNLTEAEARDRLKIDLAKFYEPYVRSLVKVKINQNEYDSLTSFCFNCGAGALQNSTLLKELNKGNRLAAADEFLKWDKGNVNGKTVVLPGLTRRRKAERELFLK